MTALVLRDWQEGALERIDAARARGRTAVLGVAATGLGKTVLFTEYANRRSTRALILAHRDELIEQAVGKVEAMIDDGRRVGRVKGSANEVGADVVVASVQTLARTKRLAQLPTVGQDLGADALFDAPTVDPFDLVIVDEAHHTAADSYRRILDYLGCGKPGGPFLLGVTATADRGDGKGLDDLFDEVAFSFDILWGIRAGYLSDMRGLAVHVDKFDTGSLKVSKGDYDQGQAGRLLEEAGGAAHITAAWKANASDRRTLVFTPTVAFAEDVVATMRADGIAAGSVTGAMPTDERRAVLAAFSRGDLQVLANCAVLTEGYDEPRVDCVVVARPTKSRGLYVQMVGRGTRRHPDKSDCLVLDVVGASDQHSMVVFPSLFGLGGNPRAHTGEVGVVELVDERDAEEVRLGRLKAEDVDLFRKLRARAKIAWVPVHTEGSDLRRYHRTLPDGKPTVVLAQRVAGENVWTAGLLHRDGTKRGLMVDVALETAQGVAEDYILKSGAMALAAAGAKWRAGKPTAKQKAAASRWGVKVDPAWTAGDLSDAIDRRAGRIAAGRSSRPA